MCLQAIDLRFHSLRNINHQPTPGTNARSLHSCTRNPDCDCGVLASYLIAIAYQQNEENVKVRLESKFFLEPEVRLPYKPFLDWV